MGVLESSDRHRGRRLRGFHNSQTRPKISTNARIQSNAS